MSEDVMTDCPVCTCPLNNGEPHTDEECVAALIKTGLFAKAPFFTRTVPPASRWTPQERDFANQLAMQAIRWKKAELSEEAS